MIRNINFYVILLVVLMPPGFQGCRPAFDSEPDEYRLAKEVVHEWNLYFLDLERFTPGYRAPVASRTYAYVSCAAWQAALPGMKDCVALDRFCTGAGKPEPAPAAFYLPASLNAAYAEIMRQFFPTAPAHLLERLNLLEDELSQRLRSERQTAIYKQSAAYGKKCALAVWRWSVSDSLGHDGFLYNYDRDYTPPNCTGCWEPDISYSTPAVLPYWGRVRPFIVQPDEVVVKNPLPVDDRSGSPYYAETLEVFAISQPLTKENKWIAEFWSDDIPGLTMSPAGRWVSIATQAVETARLPLPEVLEMNVKLGFAMADAIIICWDAKYHFNRERPVTAIRRLLKPDWYPLHDNPSFPSYPSGHSTLGAAAAAVLTHYLGENFEMTDRTHVNRREFNGDARTFGSFTEMARENAISRIALGVHFRMDCEEGLRIGRIVGLKVAGLPLNSGEVSIGFKSD